MIKIRIGGQIIEKLAWIIILTIHFGLSLLSKFSVISNVMLFGLGFIYLHSFNKKQKIYNNWLICVLLVLISYSLCLGNQLLYALRFAALLFFIFNAYSWRVDSNFFLKTIFILSSTLIILLICLEVFLFSIPHEEYATIRNGIILANGMGDIFYYNDLYYKLELMGTPLIVFIYMLSYITDIFPRKYRWLFRGYYFVGTILAGNFAYQLAIIIFHFAYYVISAFDNPQLLLKRTAILFAVILIVGGVVFSFVSNSLEEKADDSNAKRYEQVEVLWDDMSQSELTLLFGSGLGHTVPIKTQLRDYRGSIYFEIQTLYYLNQLGLLGFTLFLLTNLMMAFRTFISRNLLMIYGIYVLYAFVNPYIWDTTHIIVIVSLSCALSQLQLKKKKNEQGNLCLSPVQSAA